MLRGALEQRHMFLPHLESGMYIYLGLLKVTFTRHL